MESAKVLTGAESLFSKSTHAELYSLYRPKPPQSLIDHVMSFVTQELNPPFNQAVDVGCGSGQSTELFLPYFKNVLGIDISNSQINETMKKKKNSNVQYKVGGCDSIPLPNSSTELVSACQAAHWFNLPSFYHEADRILVPGGVLALSCYSSLDPYGEAYSMELLSHIEQVYARDTAGYWHENINLVDELYSSFPLPYEEQMRDVTVYLDAKMTIQDYINYITTWSGYQNLHERNPEKAEQALLNFQARMMKTLNVTSLSDKKTIAARWKYALVMARKPLQGF